MPVSGGRGGWVSVLCFFFRALRNAVCGGSAVALSSPSTDSMLVASALTLVPADSKELTSFQNRNIFGLTGFFPAVSIPGQVLLLGSV